MDNLNEREIQVIGINQVAAERLAKIFESSGFSLADESPPPPLLLLAAIRSHALDLVELAKWRFEQVDMLNRELSDEELMGALTAFESIATQIRVVLGRSKKEDV